MRTTFLLLWVVAAVVCGARVPKFSRELNAAEPSAEPVAKPKSPRYVFAGRAHEIGRGRIVASLADPYWCDQYNQGQGKQLAWSIAFDAKSKTGTPVPPTLEFHGMDVEVNDWRRLVGYKAKWNDAINPNTGQLYGMAFRKEHLNISKGSVEVVDRDGTRFHVVAQGEDEEGQPFEIDGWAEFQGIYVRGSERDTHETILARLQAKIATTNLSGSPFKLNGAKYNSGVRMGDAFFRPKGE